MDTQQKEIINRHLFIAQAIAAGYEVAEPIRDNGIDLILYRGDEFRKVQLKGRWTIERKYVGGGIWMAFPVNGAWYLMPHDAMVASAVKATATRSWVDGGLYTNDTPPRDAAAATEAYRFGP